MSDLNQQLQETQSAAEVAKDNPQPEGQQKIEISIEPQVAFTLKCQEYDKLIAEAEKQVADLKAQKASYIYDTNTQIILKDYQEKQIRAKVEEQLKAQQPAAK